MSVITPINHALLRADLWRLLALGFARPTPEQLQDLVDLAGELQACLADLEHPLAAPVARLIQALSETEAQALEEEYHALFTTHVLVSPYEGAYHRTERGAIIGDVAAFYRAFSLQWAQQSGPPDALWHELAFLSWLALKEAYALEHQMHEALDLTRGATRQFLVDHLGRWVAVFVRQLLGTTGNPVYVTAAALLVETVALAAEDLGIQDFNHVEYGQDDQEADTIICPIAGQCAQ